MAFAPIHDGKYEFTPYPSCLKSVLRHLGNDASYHYLLATSGAAFRLVWHASRWEGGNVDIIFMAEDPLAPFKRAVQAAGYGAEIILNSAGAWGDGLPSRQAYFGNLMEGEEAVFRRKIVASIDAGVPVIVLGVVGPPEACIVTGYDNAGDVLIGWSMFQEHLDPEHDIGEGDMNAPVGIEESGYFRQNDWHGKLRGVIVLGEKTEVDLTAIYRSTLEWIPTVIKTSRAHEFYTGQGAYDAYIEKMSDDSEFPADDLATVAERKMVHYDAMTMISERGGGAAFLRDVAAHAGFVAAREEITKAADAFEDAAAQMRGWWDVAGKIWDDEEAQIRATADPGIRRAFVPYIRKSKESDLEGAGYIERALEKL